MLSTMSLKQTGHGNMQIAMNRFSITSVNTIDKPDILPFDSIFYLVVTNFRMIKTQSPI